MHLGTIKKTVKHFHLYCGSGGGAKGFNKGKARVGNYEAEFVCIGGIDSDPAGCRDFKKLTGTDATCMDLFSREQYRDFHGKEPPPGWREATPDDVRRAGRNEHPHIGFLSAPCKGFSGLLSEKMSVTKKYQALNGLTLRGLWLFLEAHKDDPVELLVFENVPRIATRGRYFLDQIIALGRAYGYAVAESTHDCGELGNLGQSRKRFLLVMRFIAKVPTFLYEPIKHPLRGVGEILDRRPIPGLVPGIGGPMHRMPSLQWKTWVRLAFVEAGKDWRSLNGLRVDNGMLQDFGIMPDNYAYGGPLGVKRWSDVGATVSGMAHATRGAFNVADPREFREQDFHGLRVNTWRQTAGPITTQRSPGSSAQSVADPRVDGHHKSVQLGVGEWGQPAAVVKGDVSVGTGRYAVADPRSGYGPDTHKNVFRVVPWGGHAGTVGSGHGPSSGGQAVADPRHPTGGGGGKYRVTDNREPSNTVIGASTTGQGAFALADPRHHDGALAIADPRPGERRSAAFGVKEWDNHSGAIGGESLPPNGTYAVADPRPDFLKDTERREHYNSAGNYGVVPWRDPSGAVASHGGLDNGRWSVADPRLEESDTTSPPDVITLPGANDKLVCTIRALDGTWHRPFTTLELAALQGLVDPEEELILDGMSDSAWRERIGNMVPPPAATAIAGVCGVTLLAAWSGQTFMMGSTPIWVRPVAVALMAAQGDVPEVRP